MNETIRVELPDGSIIHVSEEVRNKFTDYELMEMYHEHVRSSVSEGEE